MTAKQLYAIARQHGYDVITGTDGRPALKALRPDANMPYRTLCLFKRHRELFIAKPDPDDHPRKDWEKCQVCQSDVAPELKADDAETLCDRKGGGGTKRCPYMHPL